MKQLTSMLFVLLVFLSIFLTPELAAQEAAKWSAKPVAATVKAGGTVDIKVTAHVVEGWNVYSTTPQDEGPVPTEMDFADDAPLLRAGKIRQPKPIVKYDENFGIETEYYDEDATFTVPARVRNNATAGRQKVMIEVTFMACSDRLCLPPKTVEVPFELTIEAGEQVSGETGDERTQQENGGRVDAEALSSDAEALGSEGGGDDIEAGERTDADDGESLGYGDQRDVERAREQGLWAYVLLAMSVGGLALLTPCVFPMIPITVSFFTKREAATRGQSVRDALIYSLGIIFTFTGLGIVLALLFGASGINQFAANPWMNILIALVFIVFALNLFGLFEIVIPSGILTKLTVASGSGRGITSLLLMGLTFTLTSFTCTVPFVGAVMVAAAKGEIWWSVVGMLAFSTVFALPFFLLALFPSWMKSMPKSGGWLNSVKVVMGFLELAAAMKFISNVDLIWGVGVLSRDLFLSFWIGISLLTVLYLLGVFILPHDSKVEKVGVFRMLWSIFFLGISVFLFTGLHDKPIGELDAFLPPMHYSETIQAASQGDIGALGTTGKGEKILWYSDYEEALAVARAESRPLFVDFTGFSCTNCRWMEANILSRSDVKALLENYVLVRLYTDGRGTIYDRNRAFQEERFGTVALPLYVTMMPDDEEHRMFPGMTRKPEEFIRFLSDGITRHRGS
ncbi:MAG: thioredoxin family protein [Bacteroidetes bacterium]|nr:thioredoxin family protein [Bacteroidota bacterium]